MNNKTEKKGEKFVTNKQLAAEVARHLGLSKIEVGKVISEFIRVVTKHMEKKENVRLFPLGTFYIENRKKKYYDFIRNIKTEGDVTVIKFKSIHLKRFFKNKNKENKSNENNVTDKEKAKQQPKETTA
jgi:nucleoid DNA-binding protein